MNFVFFAPLLCRKGCSQIGSIRRSAKIRDTFRCAFVSLVWLKLANRTAALHRTLISCIVFPARGAARCQRLRLLSISITRADYRFRAAAAVIIKSCSIWVAVVFFLLPHFLCVSNNFRTFVFIIRISTLQLKPASLHRNYTSANTHTHIHTYRCTF